MQAINGSNNPIHAVFIRTAKPGQRSPATVSDKAVHITNTCQFPFSPPVSPRSAAVQSQPVFLLWMMSNDPLRVSIFAFTLGAVNIAIALSARCTLSCHCNTSARKPSNALAYRNGVEVFGSVAFTYHTQKRLHGRRNALVAAIRNARHRQLRCSFAKLQTAARQSYSSGYYHYRSCSLATVLPSSLIVARLILTFRRQPVDWQVASHSHPAVCFAFIINAVHRGLYRLLRR